MAATHCRLVLSVFPLHFWVSLNYWDKLNFYDIYNEKSETQH